MEMDNIVINSVRLVIHHIVGVILIQFHFQVPVHQCFACADFDVDLVAFLSLDLTVGDEDFGLVVLMRSVKFLAILQRSRCQVIARPVVVEIGVDAPLGLGVRRRIL